MVLPKGSFWEHVEEMPDDSRRCKFCGHVFSKLIPITRFKFHWSGVPRRGTTICDKVPELVREAAFAAVDGPPEKNHRITETSSNDGAQQEEALSVKELEERIDSLHVEVDNLVGDAGKTQAADRMDHALGRSWDEIYNFLMEVDIENGTGGVVQPGAGANVLEDDIENGTGGVAQPGAGASSSGGLTGNTNETPGDPLPTSLHVEIDNVAPQGQHLERVTGQPVVRGSSHERPLVNHDEPQEDQLCPPLVNMVGNFPLDRVSSFPRDLIPGEQVEQECERNAQENLPLSVEDYRIEGTFMESSQLPVRGGSPERLTVNEDEPRGDLSQPTDPLCFGLERHYDQPSSSSVNNDVMMIDVENMIREHLQPVVRDSSREGLQPIGDEPQEDSEDVQEAAFLAMHSANKRHKSIASSSNVNDNAISTTPQEQYNEVDNLAPGTMGQSVINNVMEDDIENGTGGVVQPGAGATSSGGLTCNTNETLEIPTTKLVGQAFEDHKKTIWSWLMHDEVSTIGIYGMGGVGKTTLVKHIYDQLQKRRDSFCHVYWITVSQDTNINKLQNSIARRIGLDLSNEDEELYRAAELSNELTKKQKWVLILDDLWKAIELRKVGVPIQAVKGCKLIVTTRLENVCQQMDTQHKIKVSPILVEEAWTLFIERLGHDMALSPEVEPIAKSITNECDGLPLGIITMASTMRGVVDVREWRNALEELRESKVRKDDMEPEVFYILRFSYNHLSDSALQQCFLYCALFPEDFMIRREDLIAYLIDEE
ncbi:uncharacterized protein [Populus alba]